MKCIIWITIALTALLISACSSQHSNKHTPSEEASQNHFLGAYLSEHNGRVDVSIIDYDGTLYFHTRRNTEIAQSCTEKVQSFITETLGLPEDSFECLHSPDYTIMHVQSQHNQTLLKDKGIAAYSNYYLITGMGSVHPLYKRPINTKSFDNDEILLKTALLCQQPPSETEMHEEYQQKLSHLVNHSAFKKNDRTRLYEPTNPISILGMPITAIGSSVGMGPAVIAHISQKETSFDTLKAVLEKEIGQQLYCREDRWATTCSSSSPELFKTPHYDRDGSVVLINAQELPDVFMLGCLFKYQI